MTDSLSIALLTLNPIIHTPTLISETSTIDGSPVRSRANSAPAMPPAIVMPPMESPYAPAGWLTTRGLSDGVHDHAEPVRHQNVEPSYPPLTASGPRWPWPEPRT